MGGVRLYFQQRHHHVFFYVLTFVVGIALGINNGVIEKRNHVRGLRANNLVFNRVHDDRGRPKDD